MTLNNPPRLFLARRCDIWLDSWTYGNYRQWTYRRGDEFQCARVLFCLPFGWCIMWAVGPISRNGMRVHPWEVSP